MRRHTSAIEHVQEERGSPQHGKSQLWIAFRDFEQTYVILMKYENYKDCKGMFSYHKKTCWESLEGKGSEAGGGAKKTCQTGGSDQWPLSEYFYALSQAKNKINVLCVLQNYRGVLSPPKTDVL